MELSKDVMIQFKQVNIYFTLRLVLRDRVLYLGVCMTCCFHPLYFRYNMQEHPDDCLFFVNQSMIIKNGCVFRE